MKPECLKEYNPFFYHYTRIEQSKVKHLYLLLLRLGCNFSHFFGQSICVITRARGRFTDYFRPITSTPIVSLENKTFQMLYSFDF